MDEQHGPDHLYAPWRMEYISKADASKTGCIFCEKPREDRDAENFIVHRGERCFVIMNVFPYNTGHLMVVPYAHTGDFNELPVETYTEMMRLGGTAIAAMKRAMHPDGFNLGMNIGRVSGAGIAEHLHLHIVPRWAGDTNFISVVGHVRVLPEAMEKTWARLLDAFCCVLGDEA